MSGAQPSSLAELLGPHARILSFALSEGQHEQADPPNVRWHQVAVEGQWEGHWQGPFALTDRDFDQMVLHQRGKANDTLVDYEHRSLLAMFGGDSRAAGWLTALDARKGDAGAELWARIDWTTPAAEAIRQREYRYLSPTILWHTSDRKTGLDTGVSLDSVALTNSPFLEELPEVQLNAAHAWLARRGGVSMPAQLDAQALGLLGLAADAAPDAVAARVAEVAAEQKTLERVCTALGLEAGSGAELIAQTAQALRIKAEAAVDPEALRALQAQVGAMQTDAAIDRAKRAGKITADNETFVRSLASRDMALFAEWEKSAPAVVPMHPVSRVAVTAPTLASSGPPSDAQISALAAQLSPEQRHICDQLSLSPETFVRANYAELAS